MKFKWWLLPIALGAAGCAHHPNVKTSSAILAPMAGHKTYAYDATVPAPPGHAQGPETQAPIAKLKESIDAAMQANGYTLSPSPHLPTPIPIGLRTAKNPNAVRGGTNDITTEQNLDIDVFDHASGAQLFHGTAKNPLEHREPSESSIAESVPAILEPVPPASS